MPVGVPALSEINTISYFSNYSLISEFIILIGVFFLTLVLWSSIEVILTSVFLFNRHTLFNNSTRRQYLDYINQYFNLSTKSMFLNSYLFIYV